MSLEPFSPSNHHHHHHHVIVTRKSLLASRPRRPTWFCRTTRSRGSALLDFSTGEQGSSHHHGRGGRLVGAKSHFFQEIWNGDFLYLSLPGHFYYYLYCYNYWLSFYRLPNLATLDMSRNKIVEIEQGAFEGAYSIDDMWVFVFVLGFEFVELTALMRCE